MRFPEYSGMSYEQASREAARLIERKGWFQFFDRLNALQEIMVRKAWIDCLAEQKIDD